MKITTLTFLGHSYDLFFCLKYQSNQESPSLVENGIEQEVPVVSYHKNKAWHLLIFFLFYGIF